MSVLAIIPARSGSKGIKDKNTRNLLGKPLISWTIEAALNSECIDRVIVSTDSSKIAGIAEDCGADVPFLRPAALATDEATTTDVVLHALQECSGFEKLILLQPTSPMRTSKDIQCAFQQMVDNKADACVSVYECDYSPWLMYRRNTEEYLCNVLEPWVGGMRRQDLPQVYMLNGAIYVVSTEYFTRNQSFMPPRTHGYEMSEYDSIDIDTVSDFVEVEKRLSTKLR